VTLPARKPNPAPHPSGGRRTPPTSGRAFLSGLSPGCLPSRRYVIDNVAPRRSLRLTDPYCRARQPANSSFSSEGPPLSRPHFEGTKSPPALIALLWCEGRVSFSSGTSCYFAIP